MDATRFLLNLQIENHAVHDCKIIIIISQKLNTSFCQAYVSNINYEIPELTSHMLQIVIKSILSSPRQVTKSFPGLSLSQIIFSRVADKSNSAAVEVNSLEGAGSSLDKYKMANAIKQYVHSGEITCAPEDGLATN